MANTQFSNLQLVTIAVARLGGQSHFVDGEEVAIYVNELAPGRFTWKKYPENIDLEAVVIALRDARKEKNGPLLIGNSTKGWMLTPVGVKWNASVSDYELNETDLTKPRKHSIMATQESETARLRTTRAYQLFMNGEFNKINLQDLYQFVRINEYFQTKARLKRISAIENAVATDKVLEKFWKKLKQKFAKELG